MREQSPTESLLSRESFHRRSSSDRSHPSSGTKHKSSLSVGSKAPHSPLDPDKGHGFRLPVLSSTPLSASIFHKRRSSASVEAQSPSSHNRSVRLDTCLESNSPSISFFSRLFTSKSSSKKIPHENQVDENEEENVTQNNDEQTAANIEQTIDVTEVSLPEESEWSDTLTHASSQSPETSRDVGSMERSLLNLLHDFKCGKCRAFDDTTMHKMKEIRDRQELLAKMHLAVLEGPTSSDQSLLSSQQRLDLARTLRDLSEAIQTLRMRQEYSHHDEHANM